jgi:hypothetical protein
MKKNRSRAPDMHVDQGDTFATPILAVVPSNETTSGNIMNDADIPKLKTI